MPSPSIIGFSGNFTRPSKTRAFVDYVAKEVGQRHGLESETFDILDLGPSFRVANWAKELDEQASAILQKVKDAELVVVGTPTFKGSYTGLLKHFFDLIDPSALRGKPVLLTATGGGERHSLIVEHQLRPLFGFFESFALPTAIYATERDFVDGAIASDAVIARVAQAVDESARALLAPQYLNIAAE